MTRSKKPASSRGPQSAPARIYFADIAYESAEPDRTLPAKFKRMLEKLALEKRVKEKSVTIKMHLGGHLGYTTIHPLFVRLLVEALKTAGAKDLKVMDNSAKTAFMRGYTHEVLGCPVIPCFGQSGRYYYREPIGFRGLDEALLSGEALDSDFFIDLAHLKGHGDCGFGGAIKNIAMGIVPSETRRKIHGLEGGLVYDADKCIFCLKCHRACPNGAITINREKKKIGFFFHNCTYCQHCVLACPKKAIRMENRRFEDFSRGLALVTSAFLKKFAPENLLFINFLMNITIFCDCWGMSTPSLVPDIGILAAEDITAIETASLDLIKTENLLPNGLPKDRKLSKGKGHLFERIHGKDPYLMVRYLEEIYGGTRVYKRIEVK
ncbi:MAG TPA: DUF362 domain-containing protein [bacterium]|uniref:NADH-plastoquinone oxidoreductase subunit n=1 Tax=candidate division TA06 bacterium ADurb.Bin417 TaxID=1852828 RepID=A0A1V5MJZ4_UNCT6|nr:MAG: NADH-plastoquinone oxidoreductase subunit [candidate division TA06 bacterium ADurb.Bin417]HNQ34671.1 DUF362 domain-containing protein [bacterium]HNS49020.1 DUF362 domain-containing protein [bacterium]